jgi:hypothetical protein
MVQNMVDEGEERMILARQNAPVLKQGSRVLPTAMWVGAQTEARAPSGLAQPLPELDQ